MELTGEEAELVGQLMPPNRVLPRHNAVPSDRQVMFTPFSPDHPLPHFMATWMLLVWLLAHITLREQAKESVNRMDVLNPSVATTRKVFVSRSVFHIRTVVPFMVHTISMKEGSVQTSDMVRATVVD